MGRGTSGECGDSVKRRGQRYDALRITSEEIFSKPNKFSIIFGFDSERLKAPLQLEAEVEVRNAGTPIIARIHSGMSESFEGNVSSNLSDVSSTVRKERSMTFWDWPPATLGSRSGQTRAGSVSLGK